MNTDTFLTKLNILEEILNKKNQAMTSILNICDNLETVFSSYFSENKSIVMELGKEKQNFIDEVLECDRVFQGIFDSLVPEFNEKAMDYKEKIKNIQKLIEIVTEKDVKIRAKENILKDLVNKINPQKKSTKPLNKTYILEQYKNNSKEGKFGKTS